MEIRSYREGLAVTCPQCGPVSAGRGPAAARSAALAHLARHIRTQPLAAHLRTCQCGQYGCRWHARHRGCDGPLVLLLTRTAGGRTWRLADTCRACATATEHAAEVTETDQHPGVATSPQSGTRFYRISEDASDRIAADIAWPYTESVPIDDLTEGGVWCTDA